MIFTIVYFFKRKIIPGFKLTKKDIVVDIGSGDKPFWRANVFVDNLSLTDNQRFSHTSTVTDIGLFVNADIVKGTPFKKKLFDFSYCSHLLEHVHRPDLAIEEIMRISKAGYIEIPNGLIECIEPFSTHLWFVFLVEGNLVFYRKSKKWHNLLLYNSSKYSHLLGSLKEPFIRFYWKGKIGYKIIDEYEENDGYYGRKRESLQRGKENYLYNAIVKLLRKIYGIDKMKIDI